MARFTQNMKSILDEEQLWDVKQILELGSGTAIASLPFIKHYINKTGYDSDDEDAMPNLREIIVSDH